MEISVEIEGWKVEEMLESWATVEIPRRSRAAMEESVEYLQREVEKGFPVDTGVSSGAVFTEVRGSPMGDLLGVVASPHEHAVVLEQGRRPGAKMPPPTALIPWVRHHNLAGSYSVKTHRRTGNAWDQYQEDLEIAFAIARKIAKRGFAPPHKEGWRMFESAAKAGEHVVEEIWLRHFAE